MSIKEILEVDILFLLLTNSPKIKFLGLELTVTAFLLIASAIAFLVFLILLVILLLMYLRKRLAIKGYLNYQNPNHKFEDKILQIESEITQIQKKFYTNRPHKKSKKLFN